MLRWLTSLFKKEDKVFNYVSPKSMSKRQSTVDIPALEFENNGKPNILLMDDAYGAILFLQDDLRMLNALHEYLEAPEGVELSDRASMLLESLNESEIGFLGGYNPDNYNFIYSYTVMCGFSVEEAIQRGLVVHAALLDIGLGGVIISDGRALIIDGVDIAVSLLEVNPKMIFKMYSGCTLAEYQDEAIKFKKHIGSGIENYVIFKKSDLTARRRVLLQLIMGVS